MGNCVSVEDIQAYNTAVLLPAQPPLMVIGADFLATNEPVTTLYVLNNAYSWSDDFLTIKDRRTGVLVFQLKKGDGQHGFTKAVLDSTGQPVALVEATTRPGVHEVMRPGRTKLFTVKAILTIFQSSLNCSVTDAATGQTHALGIVGDWTERRIVITCDGRPIAKVRNPDAITNVEYYVDVAPGVDMALIVLLVAALEAHDETTPT
ncbi:Aste57867_2209 [Aphanomyces stellatus]|uniref:Aste57867_2209 protein n=1 Tax=Aphanomyces stellatus TaxID=120398 RepID=A0A485K843_9STRA|nr:hypothetical protein As57867_002204 [Aphanomyces stellatus]VFT79412.1 Aste57867_2209 [Aphanomyces stellatus]